MFTRLIGAATLAFSLLGVSTYAMAGREPTTQMSPPSINLWPGPPATEPDAGEVVVSQMHLGRRERSIKNITHPRLRIFLPDHPDPNHPACIICPGGGYSFLSLDREGDDVARMLNSHGIAAFVLVYRLPVGVTPQAGDIPVPIQDVHRAIRLVRADAAKWNIDPDRIGVMGFSAGGHVASTAATQFESGNPSDPDPVMHQSSRPDFAILMYPVVSMHDPIAHQGSRHNLLGSSPGNDLIDRYSSDQQVTKQTPPLFIVHAEDDNTVDVRNSLQMADAAARAGVPCSLTLLHQGGHGFGLGISGGEPAGWPDLCISWMRSRQIMSMPSH